jgi:predicted ATP-grasp superfamily ATP-dependent carboligase
MKLYQTTSIDDDTKFTEFTSSGDGASKARTRLKKLGHSGIASVEIEVDPTRTGLIKLLNGLTAHESWISTPVADAVGK